MSKRYKNPFIIGNLISLALVIIILAILVFLNVNNNQAMTGVGFMGIFLFLFSLRNLAKQEIKKGELKETEPLILTTLGLSTGYLLTANFSIMFYGPKAVTDNYVLGAGMGLCIFAIILLGIRLAKIKDDLNIEEIKAIEG